MAGIKDVAAAAGVSISTISNVLNQRPNVGEETRQKVLAICEKLHYIPNHAGKSLKTGRSKTILFNFSDFDRGFYLKIIEGINDYTRDNGYDLIICTTHSCEKYMCNNLTDGGIILDIRMDNSTLQRAAAARYPIVTLDRTVDHPHIKSLVVDNRESMVELMEGIVDRGYRHFAFIGGLDTDDNKERFSAFQDVLNSHNIPFHRDHYFSGDYRESSGYRGAKLFLSASEIPEIFICANDNMAIGAMNALREWGLAVPADVAVAGFDDGFEAEMLGLTTVTIPNYERGYLAARTLINLIDGKNDFEPMKISTAVQWRGTVGRIISG